MYEYEILLAWIGCGCGGTKESCCTALRHASLVWVNFEKCRNMSADEGSSKQVTQSKVVNVI